MAKAPYSALTSIVQAGNDNDNTTIGVLKEVIAEVAVSVTDAAARDALYSTPVGDEKVFRKDTGNFERYSATLKSWIIDVPRIVTPQLLGAIGNGIIDDTIALKAMVLAYLSGVRCEFPSGTYLCTDTLFDGALRSLAWHGQKNERGCNAEGNTPGYSSVKIKFRPVDTTKPLFRVYDTTAPLGGLLGPFLFENITIDVGDANGLVFGVDDPVNPTTFPAAPPTVVDNAGQKYIFGFELRHSAIIGTAAVRDSVSGVITRSGKRLISLTKAFESKIDDVSLYGCDTQIHTWGCDSPKITRVRSQGSHLPIDFNGSGTFNVQHTIDDIEIEGWTFTPLRIKDVRFSGNNLTCEQSGAPVGSGRFAIPGTVSVTADSGALVFSSDMTGILWPNLSILELTDGTNVISVLVTAVSTVNVTVDVTATTITWTNGAATATRIHGYGPIHDSSAGGGSLTNFAPAASLNCPGLVFKVSKDQLNVSGATAVSGGFGDIRTLILGNQFSSPGSTRMQALVVFNGCSSLIEPIPGHPLVKSTAHRDSYGTQAVDSVRQPIAGLAEAEAQVRRKWVFTPATTGASRNNSYLTPFINVVDPGNVNQSQWAWYLRGTNLYLQDLSIGGDSTAYLRVRVKARADTGTTTMTLTYIGNGGGAGPTVPLLTTTPATYEFVVPMPTQWQGTDSSLRSLQITGTGFYLYGVSIEEITPSAEAIISENGASWTKRQVSELLTLSTVGTTTDTSANLLPANAIIEAVVARVTTAITTATSWQLGDPTTAGRFSTANASMIQGATIVGTVQADQTGAAGPRQSAAAKVRVTTVGIPGAGAVRITVFYRLFVAPTS